MRKWLVLSAIWIFIFVTLLCSTILFNALRAPALENENKEVYCLAQNIYFESRNQPLVSKIGVGLVTLNRVANSFFPNTICEVIRQSKKWNGNVVRNQCQFSWYCDGKSDIPKNMIAWNHAWNLAVGMHGLKKYYLFDITEGATHYHADYVNPKWASKFKRTIKLGNHFFYRMGEKREK